MEICAYSPALRSFFKTLNEEWLNKYFVVEPYDAFLLENCSEEIIDKGGKIFFGKLNGAVIGTYAILAPVDGCVELGKMDNNGRTPRKGLWATITATRY